VVLVYISQQLSGEDNSMKQSVVLIHHWPFAWTMIYLSALYFTAANSGLSILP
jgi:hypothetical protein